MVGRITPTAPVHLHAPPNMFRVSGWSSSSSSIQLVELVADGLKVAKGDIIARFGFRGGGALARVEQRINEAIAEAAKSRATMDEEVRDLRHALEGARLAAQRAEVDTLKDAAVSVRERQRIRIDARIAQFEADAAARRLVAQELRANAERVFREQQIELRRHDRKVFDAYQERFLGRAPIAGVVRHAFSTSQKRAIQKGDDLSNGTHYASIAADDRLSVRFYLPEARLNEASPGRDVEVRPVGGGPAFRAKLRQVEPFPQPYGFLEEDWERPDALERAFVVLADFGTPPPLPAGAEVEVAF